MFEVMRSCSHRRRLPTILSSTPASGSWNVMHGPSGSTLLQPWPVLRFCGLRSLRVWALCLQVRRSGSGYEYAERRGPARRGQSSRRCHSGRRVPVPSGGCSLESRRPSDESGQWHYAVAEAGLSLDRDVSRLPRSDQRARRDRPGLPRPCESLWTAPSCEQIGSKRCGTPGYRHPSGTVPVRCRVNSTCCSGPPVPSLLGSTTHSSSGELARSDGGSAIVIARPMDIDAPGACRPLTSDP